MATTLFFALIVFIVFTNIYPALDKSNSSAGNLTYPENTGSLFQSRLDSLLHFIARVRFASSSQRRIRLAIVAWKTWYAFGVDGRSLGVRSRDYQILSDWWITTLIFFSYGALPKCGASRRA